MFLELMIKSATYESRKMSRNRMANARKKSDQASDECLKYEVIRAMRSSNGNPVSGM